MIVNKYAGKFRIKPSIANLDLFLLQEINQVAKSHFSIGLSDNFDKWIQQKYWYRIRKYDTEEYLKRYYDAKKSAIIFLC